MEPWARRHADDYREAGRWIGPYEVVRRIAVGGMAEVFLANHVGVQGITRPVVLKRILPSYTADPAFLRMFQDEVRIVAGLSHPNVAHVYDLGEDRGQHYIVMEHVDGPSLTRLLNLCRPEPMPVEHAVEVACGIAQALFYAHTFRGSDGAAARIIHRDVSPHNVLLSRDGQVKLVDFGVAKAAGQADRSEGGALKGKLAYMAPERLRGEPYDHRVDIFSLGVVLHEMLTGARLFKRETMPQTAHALLREPISAPSERRPGLSQRLDAIVLGCLARDPSERYGNADEVAFALEAWRLEEGSPGNPILLGRFVRSLLERSSELVGSDPGRSGPPGLDQAWSGPVAAVAEVAPASSVGTTTGSGAMAVAPPGRPSGPGTPRPWDVVSPPPPAPGFFAWLDPAEAEGAPPTPAPLPADQPAPRPSPPAPDLAGAPPPRLEETEASVDGLVLLEGGPADRTIKNRPPGLPRTVAVLVGAAIAACLSIVGALLVAFLWGGQGGAAPPTGRLVLTLSDGDRVELDGVAVDPAAVAAGLELPAGDHLVRVLRPGREPWSARTTVPASGTARLEPWAGEPAGGPLSARCRCP